MCSVAHKKTPIFCFWYVVWKEHQLVFYPLCSSGCSLLCWPMHGSSLCSQLMPSASQPEDHTSQGTLLTVTCRPRAPCSPSLEPWQCQYLPTSCRTHSLLKWNPTDTHKKTNGVDTKAWKMKFVQLLKFLLVIILKTRVVFLLLLSYAQSYIYISQVNSTFS